MVFEKHLELEGKHSFLSPSQHSWLRYSKDKLIQVFRNRKAAEYGTRLHAYAKESIDLGISLPRNKNTLNLYVNDAIKYGMQTEVCLYYSPNCWGWADAISFDEEKKLLRIHDLKTGEIPASMEQLEIYAALFCLRYNYRPIDISIELRLYQSNQVLVHEPDPEWIASIIDIIIECDKILVEEQRGIAI